VLVISPGFLHLPVYVLLFKQCLEAGNYIILALLGEVLSQPLCSVPGMEDYRSLVSRRLLHQLDILVYLLNRKADAFLQQAGITVDCLLF
jgi:hypothetical protein